jgi:D-arabinitol 4-dehydrogenase
LAAPKKTILHLGLGAFHRAHQAVWLQRQIDSGDDAWTLAGGNIRADSEEIIATLIEQDGAYTLETVAPNGERDYETIRAISTVVRHRPDLFELIGIGADPNTRIVSFTVTESGYCFDANDRLDFAAARTDGTIYVALAAILRARLQNHAGPLTLLCCDNLRHNGARTRRWLLEFLDEAGDTTLRDWVAANTTSPGTMVDRITPRPPPELRDRVKAATGRDDAAPVMAERFIQWVIEDNFCNERPAWEKAGVEMVADVAPHEEAKIRILNASHSCLAWAGALASYLFIHEAVRDARIRQIAHDFITDEAIPCLAPSPVNLESYRDTVLDRFGNVALGDTIERVAMDGFAKLPGFIAPTIHERLARGEPIAASAMLPALFLAFLQRRHRGELPFAYRDQAMPPAAATSICESADPVGALCGEASLWGTLAGDARLVTAVCSAYARVGELSGVIR